MTRRYPSGWWILPAVILGAMIWSAIFAAAFAGDIHRWSADSYILIQPSSRPGVTAEVIFLNEDIHASGGDFVLTLDGLSVVVTFAPDTTALMRPDRITVTPPDGFMAFPPELEVPEGGAGVILIMQGVS